jgi:small subunit ribosomal protein S16
VAVKIKLKRLGRTRVPTYRIVVADARTKRDGRAIEEIGKYHPKEEPSFIEVDSERAQHWLSVGAQPTEPVMTILKITGDWQKFKGEPGAEGTLRTKEPAADKKVRFATALKDAAKNDSATAAPKGGSRARKPDTAKADTAKPDTAKPDTAKADTAKADTAKADSGKADSGKADSGKAGAKASDTAKAEVKPESGQAKSKASAETAAAGSADDSAAAAVTSGEATEATAAAGTAESSEPGSGA